MITLHGADLPSRGCLVRKAGSRVHRTQPCVGGRSAVGLLNLGGRGNAAQSQTVREAIENGNVNQLAEIVAIVRDTGALDGTRQAAAAEAQRAIDAAMQLPANPHREAMVTLASQLLQLRT